jgi:FMN phosphatase YigB (HAD superfamily)
MNILFYINPFYVRGNPSFYEGAIKNKIAKQAGNLYSKNNNIIIMVNEFSKKFVENEIPFAKTITINQKEINSLSLNTEDVESEIYKQNPLIINKVKKLLEKFNSLEIDSVIAWETPANFIKEIYPSATLIHQMPGFLSRVPYPELLTFDANGLFNEGSIPLISTYKQDPRGDELVNYLRAEVITFIEEHNPYPRAEIDSEGVYEKLILLPLQITDQYAFKSETKYNSQLSLMIDVLERTPKRIGVVVTQYNTGTSQEIVLNEDNIEEFKSIYPNLIWNPEFNKLDNCSQYLIASVDAVATVSSSLGLQSLLWDKPLISLCTNSVSSYSNYHTIESYIEGNITNPISNNKKILSNILTYLQPLSSLTFNNPDFFNGLLKIRSNPNLHASFYDLEENYNKLFFESVKKDKAQQILIDKFNLKNNTTLADKFRDKLNEVEPELISFDIFDTLIDRTVEQPAHVFSLIEKEVEKLTDGKISNFCSLRQFSERFLRVNLKGEVQEISLNDIYDEIARRSGINDKTSKKIQELEIEQELKNLSSRVSGRKLFDIALETSANVVLISDMYLDYQTIKKIMANCGYPEIPLYLSSEVGLRKHEGDLFDYVSKTINKPHNKWLHIGDNPHGDIKIANSKGIKTFHIKSSFRNIESNAKLFNQIKNDRKTRSMAESAIYGLIQKKYFDDPFNPIASDTISGGDSSKLGYIAVAPMMFGFLQWIMTQAKNDGVRKLLFLSRDGKVLYRMAKILFPSTQGWPEIQYALSSRRSARVASIKCKGDISELMDSAISPCRLCDFFSGKFGINLLDIDDALIQNHGFKGRDVQINANDREKLRELAYSISGEILISANFERKHLKSYYESLGVTKGSNIGLVDIGYAGTMQYALEKITDASNIKGYYYITFDSALSQVSRTGIMRGYAGEFVKRPFHFDPICNNGFLYETIFCSSDSSFKCFKESTEGAIIPTFIENKNDFKRRLVVDKLHNACIAFSHDLYNSFGSQISEFHINSLTASKLFNEYIKNPGGRDAEIFEGCIFEDNFSGSKVRYIVPPRELIIKSINSTDYIWKEGTAVFSRRPDIRINEQKSVKKVIKDKVSQSKSNITEIKDFSLSSQVSSEQTKTPPKFERILVKYFIKSSNKKNKYLKNRNMFFIDSKSIVAKLYWNSLGNKF